MSQRKCSDPLKLQKKPRKGMANTNFHIKFLIVKKKVLQNSN